MGGKGLMLFEIGDDEFTVFETPILSHLFELFHYGVIDEASLREIDVDGLVLAQDRDLAAERDPVAENRGIVDGDFGSVDGLDGGADADQGGGGSAVEDVDEDLDEDAGGDADQEVGGEGGNEGGAEDGELFLADHVHVTKLLGRGEVIAGKDEHGGEGGQGNLIEEGGDGGDQEEQ